jgi:2-isopropylmalate synthase
MSDVDVVLYDTTLRDGCQANGVYFSVESKLRALVLLDELGVPYVEGGWPGANPADTDFFQRARALELENTKLAAFGSTCRVGARPDEDAGLAALLESHAPVCTLVGKASRFHVEHVLRTTGDENLRMIRESVAYLRHRGREVIFDAEHFFDGFLADPDYALAALAAAQTGGASWLVLCDTNGGTLYFEIEEIVAEVARRLTVRIGIHTHDDTGLAVANSMAAVLAGATMVQGTINGYGERTGNANLITLVGNLQLKLGMRCLPSEAVGDLTCVSREFGELSGSQPSPKLPYVGADAFAHKAGLHADGVAKTTRAYEHVDPAQVGNDRQFVVSDLCGRAGLRKRAEALGIRIDSERILSDLVEAVKRIESRGTRLEAQPEVFERLVRQLVNDSVAAA